MISLGAAALAAMSAYVLRGFTVDDAWIPVRYAVHLASGEGYRFNVGQPSTDGVTPLPWAPLLSLFASGGIEPTWQAARGIGALSWVLAAALLGKAVARAGERPARVLALLPLGLSAPLGAWAVAGLETGLVTLLATVAVVLPFAPDGDAELGDPAPAWQIALASLAAGLCAAFRPEMLPFAVVLGAMHARSRPRASRRALPALLTALPWGITVAIRLAVFGRPIPLSALAKPSDGAHGVAYVVAGLLLIGPPLLCLAPWAVARSAARVRWLLAASAAHALAVAFAGGDWMPLSRLLVPAMPPLILASALIAERAAGWASWLRAAVATAAMLFAWQRAGVAAMGVVPTRAALAAPAREALQGARSVAVLDAGWVGAALPAARIVDLAGLTDPAIAVLPGGHTSKRLTAQMLDERGVDALVLLRRSGCGGECLREDGGPFERSVEEQVASWSWTQERFSTTDFIKSGPLTYVVMRRRVRADAR